ncbi:MAG TPA: ATP-binding protein [Rhodopila sp.]|nr:ATP-binding protein [Rhodopila sp.]
MPLIVSPTSCPAETPAGSLRWFRVAIVATLVVPVLLFIGGAWLDYDWLINRATGEAQGAAEIVREHVLKVLDTNQLLIREVDWRTRDMTWDQIRANRDPLAAEMRAMIVSYPQISGIGLTDGAGREWVAAKPPGTPSDPPGIDVSHRESWIGLHDAEPEPLVTHAYAGEGTGNTVFAVSHRRTTRDGSFDGTIQITTTVAYLTEFWQKAMRDQPGARIALLRSDGDIVAHMPPLPAQAAKQSMRDTPLMQNLRETPGNSLYMAKSPIDGVECIFINTKLDDYPLSISYSMPVASLLQRWMQRLLILGGICLLANVALTGTVLLAMRQARRLHAEQGRRAAAERIALEGQRLEVLGQLAAGVAHDFGNVVQAVEMGALLIERRTTDDRIRQTAHRIGEAARQGRSLTRRMLDFARDDASAHDDGADLVLHPVDAVTSIATLLATTLGPQYRLRHEIEPDGLPALVRGDRSGLEGAIMNLAVNARDAMPRGGPIVIRLTPERVDQNGPITDPNGLAPGLYARISVEDAGIGMPAEVLLRASEPFFTTKPRGRGTGLGLAGARGFARGNGGGFRIQSIQGVGTIVSLWLPEVEIESARDVTGHAVPSAHADSPAGDVTPAHADAPARDVAPACGVTSVGDVTAQDRQFHHT